MGPQDLIFSEGETQHAEEREPWAAPEPWAALIHQSSTKNEQHHCVCWELLLPTAWALQGEGTQGCLCSLLHGLSASCTRAARGEGCTGTHTPPISLAAYKWSFLLETDFCLRWCQFFMFQGDWERCRQEEQADNRFIGWPHRAAAPSFRQPHGGEGWLRGCQRLLSLHRNCYSTKSNTKLRADIKSMVKKIFQALERSRFLKEKEIQQNEDFFPPYMPTYALLV